MGDLVSFCLPKLLNRPALGWVSGLLSNRPALELPEGCENMLELAWEDVVAGFESVCRLDGNSPLAEVLLGFPNSFDPLEVFDRAGAFAVLGAEDCDCCVVDCRRKERGLEGGGPAGVVDAFPKAKPDVGLLVGVELPKGAAVDIVPSRLPNRLLPPVVPPTKEFDAWLVSGA